MNQDSTSHKSLLEGNNMHTAFSILNWGSIKTWGRDAQMNGHKSSLIFCCFLVFYVLMAAGCAPSYTLKGPESLPPIVKEAMVVKLSGTELEMVNSGIYLNEGALYSIVAAGFINWYSQRIELNDPYVLDLAIFLEIRIGQGPYFNPLRGTYYSLNGTTRIAHANGNLYLALNNRRFGKFRDAMGDFDVLIIAWKTDDRAQIVGFLQKLREGAKKFITHTNFIEGFDDAIDRTKELW
jgi:hypothetical protein